MTGTQSPSVCMELYTWERRGRAQDEWRTRRPTSPRPVSSRTSADASSDEMVMVPAVMLTSTSTTSPALQFSDSGMEL